MEKNIRNSLNIIAPDKDAKDRMYNNILEKSKQQSKKAVPINLTKFALPIAACLVIAVVGVMALNNVKPPVDFTDDNSDIMEFSPFEEVSDTADFLEIGVAVQLPEICENPTFAIIDGEIANIEFTADGNSYMLNASVLNSDFSGINGNVIATEKLNTKYAVIYTVDTSPDIVYKVHWQDGKTNFYLCTSSENNLETVKEITEIFTKNNA